MFCLEIFGEFLPSKSYDSSQMDMKNKIRHYKRTLSIRRQLFGKDKDNLIWDNTLHFALKSFSGLQHINIYKYVCLNIYLNKHKSQPTDPIDPIAPVYSTDPIDSNDDSDTQSTHEEVDEVTKRNDLKFMLAKDNALLNELVISEASKENATIYTEKDFILAQKLVKDCIFEHKNQTSKSDDSKKKLKLAHIVWKDGAAIDPVLIAGGFKYIPNYHDLSIFTHKDLMERMKNHLYEDITIKENEAAGHIFSMAILSRADVDLITFTNSKLLSNLGIDKYLQRLQREDLNFKFKVIVKDTIQIKDKVRRDTEKSESNSDSSYSSNSDESDTSYYSSGSNESGGSDDSSGSSNSSYHSSGSYSTDEFLESRWTSSVSETSRSGKDSVESSLQ